MDDLTEYLKQAKIKLIGFDYTDEKECLKAIQISVEAMYYLEDPSTKLIEAGRKRGVLSEFRYSCEYIIELIKKDRRKLGYLNISKLTEEQKEILMYLV